MFDNLITCGLSFVHTQLPTYGRVMIALGVLFSLDFLFYLPFAGEGYSDRSTEEEAKDEPRRRHLLFMAV